MAAPLFRFFLLFADLFDSHTLRRSPRIAEKLRKALARAEQVCVADYDHGPLAETAFELDNDVLDLHADLDSLPPEVFSSHPNLYNTTRESESPGLQRSQTLSHKQIRNARRRAYQFQRDGHRPNANTIRDVVDAAAVAPL